MISYIINSFMLLFLKKEYQRFINTGNVREVQEKILLDILNRNKTCRYGAKHGFSSIKSIVEFQKRIPVTIYDDYTYYIERIKQGEENVLTTERVIMFEPTSGSTSATKYIPYTGSLKKEFQEGIKPWLYNLYSEYKGLKHGKSYWSITPATVKKAVTQGGIPIGFDEDSDYLGGISKKVIEYTFAVPSAIVHEKDMDPFYLKTSAALLLCNHLTLISIWHPTYFLLLLEFIENNFDRIMNQMSVCKQKQASEMKEFVETKEYKKIWPELKVISCWSDGNAGKYAEKLGKIFPEVEIQPKGLIATEGFISFPLKGENGGILSIYSHFFEFQSLDDDKIYLADELKKGREYLVLITTGGGFYRYNMNDIIEVTGEKHGIPLLKFKGKNDLVSDYFGEKLSEQFIINIMKLFINDNDFYLIAFEIDRYILFTDAVVNIVDIDTALRENFNYDYCRKLGQLKALGLFCLTGNPEKEYINGCVLKGQRLGDIKINRLSKHNGWDKIFEGGYI